MHGYRGGGGGLRTHGEIHTYQIYIMYLSKNYFIKHVHFSFLEVFIIYDLRLCTVNELYYTRHKSHEHV